MGENTSKYISQLQSELELLLQSGNWHLLFVTQAIFAYSNSIKRHFVGAIVILEHWVGIHKTSYKNL